MKVFSFYVIKILYCKENILLEYNDVFSEWGKTYIGVGILDY